MTELPKTLSGWPSPAFVVDQNRLENNLKLLHQVQKKSGAKIMLALKAFAMWHSGPLISQYLSGASASGLLEAKLAHDHFIDNGQSKGHLHTYAPAYKSEEIDEIASLSDHVIFNSVNQIKTFEASCLPHGCNLGLRINPRHSETETHKYDPCAPCSRLGATLDQLAGLAPKDLPQLSGLHMHTLCEVGSDALKRTADVLERDFADWLKAEQITWLNLGGGHHITAPGYDIELLCKITGHLRETYNLTIYLEPGEAIAIQTGFLLATVLDVIHNDMPLAILDASATAHMPDVLEMPYRPEIIARGTAEDDISHLIPPADDFKPDNATAIPLPSLTINPAVEPTAGKHIYRLGGPTCLAGDVIGDYGFAAPLKPGDRLIFSDMAHYSMVKTTHFNGVQHPAIISWQSRSNEANLIRSFGYEDYSGRLS